MAKLTVRVPADYLGYMAMKVTLEAIVSRAKTSPYNTSLQDVGELATSALDFVESTEKPEP